jgi:3-hexulose-6-phosphate synthase
MPPLLQIALDTLDGDHALSLAQAVAPHIAILEAGTPLIKSVGIGIVSQLKDTCPGRLVLADLKSSDVGAYEAEMAFRAGADIVTTQGITTDATIEAVRREARKWGRRAEVDLTGVGDPVGRTQQIMALGIDLVLAHRSIDEQLCRGATWDDAAVATVRRLCALGLDVGVAGGIDESILPYFEGLPLYCIVLGRCVTGTVDPAATAKQISQQVHSLWHP